MKTRKLLLYILIAGIVALFLQLLLHELGHLVFALITGNKVAEFSISSSSYTGINVTNLNSIPIISLGAFILPIAFCIALSFLKFSFAIILNMFVGVITAIQLGLNSIGLLTVDSTSVYYNTYDLQLFVNSTNSNYVIVAIIALIIAILLSAFVVCKGMKEISKL